MFMTQKLKFKPKDIEKLYKDQAQQYSNFANDSFSWKYLEKPLLDKVLGLSSFKSKNILDAGCGMGRTLKYLLDEGVDKNNITGVDISEDMLKIAKNNVPSVKTLKTDLSKFETKNKFDLILCTHVLHYLDNEDFTKTLKNFYKLLKPKGILLFVVTHPVRTTRHNLAEYFKNDWIVDHTPWSTTSPLFIRTVADMVNETIKAGFRILSVEEPSVLPVSQKADLVNFLKYSCCPSRIAVVARKD
ncbi:MAG: type 11 methyltransferase [Candidatus Woesebacteria bacterium GW2011_GWB1_39_10]|uniref:Type 11 methyltransferase n=2 Tax=Candidatus Woeseibacteriota TaxID=1752722 RepID=A0A0G0UYQ4_9BACT|nr:MAG: type 11 methyltransferase [Candidatus Woesebacteria bacterium GW2011_GWB1_39_10]KKR92646.1 MAG: type 11 methyltransferase [Candidatus Woesebacteria bacterium GW2011_GWA1_41_13b]